jgi:hypothetical protein
MKPKSPSLCEQTQRLGYTFCNSPMADSEIVFSVQESPEGG